MGWDCGQLMDGWGAGAASTAWDGDEPGLRMHSVVLSLSRSGLAASAASCSCRRRPGDERGSRPSRPHGCGSRCCERSRSMPLDSRSALVSCLQAAQEALKQLTTERPESEPLPEFQVRGVSRVSDVRAGVFTAVRHRSVSTEGPCVRRLLPRLSGSARPCFSELIRSKASRIPECP